MENLQVNYLKRIFTILLLVVIAVVIYLGSSILFPIILAFILGVLIRPIDAFLQNKWHFPKIISVCLLYTSASISDESPYQSGDIFVFNYDELFLVRNYGENGQEILWSTTARSGNGKYLNNPKYADVKYDEEKHVGDPIPPGWYYLCLLYTSRCV